MVTDWRREWRVRGTLRALARQRVALILQPGNVWVIEKAVSDQDDTASALRTCFMRGWVESLADAVPIGSLGPAGDYPPGLCFRGSARCSGSLRPAGTRSTGATR
jgi:hypothetical protein